ncbi:hypothetical protein HOP50_01g00600 [Chloropicon primus]|uniref:Tetratricopeptide repeat domain-containing protein n=1 Tax=Chloropicon primus TaxID=1764295 RepID=A0A5B8MBR7_9CHLO|nr:hypothetical protein A3770_01p00690 [Chloropicon primus]UPQ96769.1 hypothetical protein HOP50_01g00600 [Chloropicon primus]|eukprot:QDZ17551.1 hypothetical protein A3770_01p00690 [Chloropicon primus]
MSGEVREGKEAEGARGGVRNLGLTRGEARNLALGGKWNEVVRRFEEVLSTSGVDVGLDEEGRPRQDLCLLTYYFWALFRLRRNLTIAEKLGNLAPVLEVASTEAGAAEPKAPFLLLWIHAENPIHAGDAATGLARLYGLLHASRLLRDHYEEKLQFDVGSAEVVPLSDLDAPGPESAASTASLRHAWDRRTKMVLCVTACHHCGLKQYKPALKLLSGLVKTDPDPQYVSMMAYVLLQLGDVASASKVAEAVGPPESAEQKTLRANLEGVVSFASGDFKASIAKFQEATSHLPSDPVSNNNLAVGHMYARDLHVSIKILENKLAEDHTLALRQPVVLNLCSMYELASTKSKESKQTLHTWILKMASDDFDVRTTRLASSSSPSS